jgi:hypothetical protein
VESSKKKKKQLERKVRKKQISELWLYINEVKRSRFFHACFPLKQTQTPKHAYKNKRIATSLGSATLPAPSQGRLGSLLVKAR